MQEELAKSKSDSTAQTKALEDELIRTKKDVENHQNRITQLNESNKTLLAHIEKFKRDIATMKEHYEVIQDEFAIKNAKVTSDKEAIAK